MDLEEFAHMSDGMTEAYREGVRNEAETKFYCQLIRYLKKPNPSTRRALAARAAAVDEVRGGMIGTTTWKRWLERNIKSVVRRRRGVADTAWMRLLLSVKDDAWKNDIENSSKTINIYDELLQLSPFRKDTIIFPRESARLVIPGENGNRELNLYRLQCEAFEREGIDPREDEFAFILRFRNGKASLDPIWIRQTAFRSGVPLRSGPRKKEAA